MWVNAQREGRPGGALCSTLQSLVDARVSWSNAAETRNPLKFAGVLQTGKPISAAGGPKFTILSEDIAVYQFFSRLWIHALVAKV